MTDQAHRIDDPASPQARRPAAPSSDNDYAVREYVGAMAAQLARMIRLDGDEGIAQMLELAARMAEQPAPRPAPVELADRAPRQRS